jgi:hypothetical protein
VENGSSFWGCFHASICGVVCSFGLVPVIKITQSTLPHPSDLDENGPIQLLPCFPKVLEQHRRFGSLRFALTRQKDVTSFDFFQELLVVHNRSEWWGSVDCVILSSCLESSFHQINVQNPNSKMEVDNDEGWHFSPSSTSQRRKCQFETNPKSVSGEFFC